MQPAQSQPDSNETREEVSKPLLTYIDATDSFKTSSMMASVQQTQVQAPAVSSMSDW